MLRMFRCSLFPCNFKTWAQCPNQAMLYVRKQAIIVEEKQDIILSGLWGMCSLCLWLSRWLSISHCVSLCLPCCLLETFLGFYTDVLNAGLSDLQSFDLATWGKRCRYFANSKFLLSLSRRFSSEVNSFFSILLLKVWCRLLEFKFKRGSVPPEVPLTVFNEFSVSQH